MADIIYPIGVQKILDHFATTITAENATNALFAVLVQGSYVASESHLDMASITTGSHEWDGAAAHGFGTGTDALEIAASAVDTAIDGSNRVQLILPNLEFGEVSTAGSPVAGCVIYLEDDSAAADTDRWPLIYLGFSSSLQPVVGQDLTILTNTNGVGLFDPND